MMCAGRPASGVLRLAMDHADGALGQGERRDEQRSVIVRFRVRGEVVEDAVHGWR